MSAKNNETLVRNIFAAFNARKIDDALKLIADTSVYRDLPTGQVFKGKEGARQFMEGWISAFQDAKVDIQRVIATDTHVVTEYVGRGTHTGPLETPNGTIQATNHKVEVPFCEIAEIRNGKFMSGTAYYDAATMMQQLGLHELAGAHK